MSIKTKKITIATLITFGLITLFFTIFPGMDSKDFSVHEFFKGMLTGMSGVATVAWFVALINALRKSGKSVSQNFSTIFNKDTVLAFAMLSLFLGITFRSFPDSGPLVLTIGMISIFISIVFNLLYVGRFCRTNKVAC